MVPAEGNSSYAAPEIEARQIAIEPVDSETFSVAAEIVATVDRAIVCVPSTGYLKLIADADQDPVNDDPAAGGSFAIESVGIHRILNEGLFVFEHLLDRRVILETLGTDVAFLRITISDGFNPLQHLYLGSLE